MSPTLDSLPYDVLALIYRHLELEDAIHLSFMCRNLRSLATDFSMCRHLADTQFPYSLEARQTTDAAEAVQRMYCRRANLALATPSSVAVLASGSSFAYTNGVLVYIDSHHMLRILDVHRNATTERVVDLDSVVRSVDLASKDVRDTWDYVPASYANGYAVIMCRHWRKRRRRLRVWLVILDTLDRPRHPSLWSYCVLNFDTRCYFVRQSATHVVCGTHSTVRADGNREWRIQIVSFVGDSGGEPRFTVSKPIYLTGLVGGDIGVNVEFAIHGEWLYAVANETSFETVEVEWTSFYHGFRCRLDDPFKTREENPYIFRRQHHEGPVNNHWTRLSLQVDERTNELQIVESRREWVRGSSRQQRTFYTTSFTWPSETEEDPGSWAIVPKDDILATQLVSDGRIRYREALERQCSDTHPEPKPAEYNPVFSLPQPAFSSYNKSAMTFLDIIDDPVDTGSTTGSPCPQRLRLRMGSRRLRSPLEPERDGQYTVRPHAVNPRDGTPIAKSNQRYKYSPVQLWPADDAPQQLWDIMNPPALARCRNPLRAAVADERSLIYMTCDAGSNDSKIVGISFDPSIRFASREKSPSKSPLSGCKPAEENEIPAACTTSPLPPSSSATSPSSTPPSAGDAGKKRRRNPDCDMWREDAMYLRLNQAMNFREDLPW